MNVNQVKLQPAGNCFWGRTCLVLAVLAAWAQEPVCAQLPTDPQGQVWMDIETRAFHKLEWNRNDAERQARADLRKLQQLRTGTVRFVDGGKLSADQAAFRTVLAMLPSTPKVSALLHMEVPSLSPEQFVKRADLLIVQPDGRLRLPPGVIYGRRPDESQRKAALVAARCWRCVAADLVAGNSISDEQVIGFQRALADWQKKSRTSVRNAGSADQAKARSYFHAAATLAKWIDIDQRKEKLTRYLHTSKTGFAGGTVGELVRYITENDLALLYGTKAHTLFTELSYDMTRQLDVRIAMIESRIERYKAQNPAHNSAVKERLIACPYGEPGYWGTRPSTFNFPQGEQPAGLQSQAYGRPLPSVQLSNVATSAVRAGSLTAPGKAPAAANRFVKGARSH